MVGHWSGGVSVVDGLNKHGRKAGKGDAWWSSQMIA